MDDNDTLVSLMKAAEEIQSRRSLSDLAISFGIAENFKREAATVAGLRSPEPERQVAVPSLNYTYGL